MSQIRLVVRDAERDLHGTPHGSDADRLIAAPGPMFWHLDGGNLDDDFAFSFHRTLDQ